MHLKKYYIMVMVMVVVMVVIIVIIMDGGMLLFMVVYIFTTLPILGSSSNFVHRLKSIHYLQKEYYSMVIIIVDSGGQHRPVA